MTNYKTMDADAINKVEKDCEEKNAPAMAMGGLVGMVANIKKDSCIVDGVKKLTGGGPTGP